MGLCVRRTGIIGVGSSSGREVRSRVSSNAHYAEISSNSEDDEDSDFEPEQAEEEGSSSAECDSEGLVDSDDEIRIHDRLVDPEDGAWEEFDEGDYNSRMYENGILFQDAEIGEIELQSWLLFTDREHFREVFTDYCIQEGIAVIVIKTDSLRYTAECGAEGCPWRIHVARLPDGTTWAIKTITEAGHTCSRLQNHNPMATPEWAARHLYDEVRANPELPAQALNNMLFERFGVCLRKSSMYKMKELAVKRAQGGHDESYKLLPAYCEMIKSTNPGSITFCAWKRSEVLPERALTFSNLFISYHANVEGVIKGCRPLVGVDGTHLKGNYGGVLLTAVLLDGNNEIFPLAFSVVMSETKESWSGFFSRLKMVLSGAGRTKWTVICDRQKGVDGALEEVWPEADRRFCVRHLCMQYKKEYPGPLMYKLFWTLVNAYSEFTYKKTMDKMKKHKGLGVETWLKDQGALPCWARHSFDPTICSESNTSNFVESFNALLGLDRCKPILTLLEGIRRSTMVRHAERQEEAEKWDANGVTPYVKKRLQSLEVEARFCKVFNSGRGLFEVKDGRSSLTVSLVDETCACGVWQHTGIPCRHGLAIINHLRAERIVDFVSPWFHVSTYKQVYAQNIIVVPDHEQWPEFNFPVISPPTMKRRIGRPARKRKRQEGEKRKGKRSNTVRCSKCKQFGHNRKTCAGGLTAREMRNLQTGEGTSRAAAGRSTSEVTADLGAEGLDFSSAPWVSGTQQTPQG